MLACRFQRPPWSTGILIPASFLCGITAAVLIWRGGEKTKRVEEVRSRLRATLAEKQLPGGNLTHTSNREVGSQTAMLANARENDINHSTKLIDKQETVPPAG